MSDKLKQIKEKLQGEGFIILGVFGSYARGDQSETSDIDFLYELEKKFIDKYGGFGSVARLEAIKKELKKVLGREIGLTAKNSLNETGKRYILKDLAGV